RDSAYAVSSRGGCHLRAYPISYEILRKPVAVDRFSFEGKARMIKLSEDLNAVIDSLTACKFVFFSATLEEYSRVISAVTGIDYSVQDLLNIGDRICKLERSLNNQNGFDIKDDILPDRFFTEEGSSTDQIKICPINKKDFLDAVLRYYKIRGASSDGKINL
ncbi:MAG: aldehyde ferredoxin oxidoreductase C-terminal domain-containing protein, partial [Thermodesulfovibrionales bacterium]|nr:aldehyde ferredoxin oxidoreductase C-terminal domain-containing protein [Thermodesulfovibrionales bacterium]